ncbi:MAG: apolipoprotein N-acyltransferase [Myxococcales bacterium]|nr:apolipoprotein N-acyltransferase [Myxococcales bacterium]
MEHANAPALRAEAEATQEPADKPAAAASPAAPAAGGPRLPGRLERLVACLLCAACMVTSSPDYDLWWLAFVGWIPWLWSMEGLRPKAAFFYGWLTGTITVFWGFLWMTALLTRFAGFDSLTAYGFHLLFALAQGLQWAAPAALLAWLVRRTGRDVLLLAPLCWVAGEALLPHLFPSYMALSWCWQPIWLQTAEIGGVTTIGLIQLLINAGLYVLLRDLHWGRGLHRKGLITAVATLVLTPTYGLLRMAQVDAQVAAAPKVKIGVVQGNFGITQWGSMRVRPQILANLQRESTRLELEKGAELLLWGETAYPYSRKIERHGGHDLPEHDRRRIRRGFTVPLIFGLVTADDTSDFAWNSALVLKADGTTGEVYDKVYPLYFGEHIPLVDPHWYLSMVPAASHINAGARPVPLSAAGYKFGPLICYEDILPRFARWTANEGVHAFVNLTNDSWFGKTKEQHQHLGLAVLRTIENRRALLRSVNAGTSVYVDPAGRVVHMTEVTDPDVDGLQAPVGFVADVPMMDPDEVRTIYMRTGELFNGLVVLTLVLLGRRRRKDA